MTRFNTSLVQTDFHRYSVDAAPIFMKTINVFLADDHLMILDSLAMMISTLPGIRVVGKATNGQEALARLKSVRADVLLSDMHMPVMNGLKLSHELRSLQPQLRIILLTMEEEEEVVQAARDAGICGYVLKKATIQEVEKAIRTVVAGKTYYMQGVSGKSANSEAAVNAEETTLMHTLSKRELQIIRMIVNDVPGSEIAKQLFISPKTVETHRRNIFRKLDIHSAVALTRIAIQYKLI
jgi:DNA-binding NarL/FixJ family response regulator